MNSIGKPRVEWIDVAKALSILMVTMLHVGQLANAAHLQVWRIYELNEFLAPVRMPLFFAAAGIFAGSAIRKPWPELLHRKVALYLWLFVAWTTFRWLFCAFLLPNPDNPTEGSHPVEIAWALLMPTTGLWFLWCLAIFFVLTKALAGCDRKATLAITIAISIAAFAITDGPRTYHGGLLDNLAHKNAVKYFAFFYGAAMFPTLISGLGRWKALHGAGIALTVFALSYALYDAILGPLSAVFRFGASVSGVAMLFFVARELDNHRLPSTVLRYLGINTLPIYVAQVPLIAVFVAVLQALGATKLGPIANLLVPVGVVVVVVAGLGLHTAFERIGLGSLYRLPRIRTRLRRFGLAAA